MPAENGQYETAESFYYLDMCCRYVADKFGRPQISEWKNGDYINLSSTLSHHTHVYISPNTLKRIFGKLKTTDRYYPQKATRDALVRYAGYEDWNGFVQKHPRPVIRQEEKAQANTDSEHPIPETSSKIKNKTIWIVSASILIIVLAIGVFTFLPDKKIAIVKWGDASLVCNNPQGENPHSAVFKLQLQPSFHGNPDSFKVRFGDNKPQKRKITPGDLLTHYYEIPGRYYAVLEYNDTPLDTVAIFLKTSGWTATARMDRDTVRVYPIMVDSLFRNGSLHVTANEVRRSGVDTNRTFFVDFVNAKPLNISGDNFELSAGVTTSPQRPGVRCSQVSVTVFGENAQHYVFFIKPGCVSWISLQFSEIFKEGETDDLSSMGADFSMGGTFKLTVLNKLASIWIGNKKVYELSYNHPLRKIYGVKITFSGIGSLNDLSIKDLGTGEHFNKNL